MHSVIAVNENTFWIGVNDRQTLLFEALWPMPRGISYNSYIILDDKVAVLDTVKNIFLDDYLKKIKGLVGEKSIDYLIINHIEPDHSGAIKALLEHFPGLQIIGNKKTIELLADFFDIHKNFRVVKDGETLDLGQSKLKFLLTPMVHWPETMMTYAEKDNILFSGDAFGGFGTLNGFLFDDEVDDLGYWEEEIFRYFTNVIARYSAMVLKALDKVKELPIKMIASTHGIVWRKQPEHIIKMYEHWSHQETEEGVVIAYASMYGNTQKMMEALARSLVSEGVKNVKTYDVSQDHASYIISEIWRCKAVILGSPTYNMKLFPLMDSLTRLLENKMIKKRLLGIFGSHGWTGGGMNEFIEFGKRIKWELIEPTVEAKGTPFEDDLKQCVLLGQNVAKRLKSNDSE